MTDSFPSVLILSLVLLAFCWFVIRLLWDLDERTPPPPPPGDDE